jgi:polysaccharide chain length determinant protein (PEP-CTERM system associated)
MQAEMLVELWRMFLRRFWILAGIGLIGVLGAGFIAYVLPPVYEAQARILVESQQIPSDLAQSTVTVPAAERLQLIQQRLMTRENLLRVIQDLGLFRDRPDLSVSEKIEQLRLATTIRPITIGDPRARRGNVEISAFTITVAFPSARDAARITNEFVTTVLEQNIRNRSQRASETLEFFRKEEQRLAEALADIEERIVAFKDENQTVLPDSLDFRRQEAARLEQRDQAIDQSLIQIEQQRLGLQTSLAQVAAAPPPARSPEEQQIQQLEATLAQKRAIYSDSNPAIRSLRAQIAVLRANLPARAVNDDVLDPKEAQMASIRRQMELLETQVALLQEQKSSLVERKARLEESIRRTPEVEVALNALYRRQTALQAQYGEIVRKRTEAETGEKLEVNQQAERFEVVENAVAAEEPVSPDRMKIVVLGSGFSLALALGIAFLVEMLRPAIRSTAQMERKLELRPVVAIPRIRTQSERRRRVGYAVLFLLLIGGGIPAALYLVDEHYMPLELVGTKIAEKTGLGETIRIIENRL